MIQLTRRRFYTALAACVAYPFGEALWLQVHRRSVRMAGLRSPIRLLHLSDLHYSRPVPLAFIEHAISAGLAEKPDLICLTGDYVTRGAERTTPEYARVLSRLSAAAPTYAVLGNHDGGAWCAIYDGRVTHKEVDTMLEQAGIQLLHNRSVTARVRDSSLTLVGVGDLWSQELDATRAFKEVKTTAPIVLLNHNPDGKDLVARSPWSLMLSGHTHGGQAFFSNYAPVEDKRYLDGLKPWGGRQIHVSRGVGNLVGVRIGCPPEITLLELL